MRTMAGKVYKAEKDGLAHEIKLSEKEKKTFDLIQHAFSELRKIFTIDEAIELMNNSDLMQTQFKELKKSMIKYIRKEIRGVSTYQLQKNGIDSKSYKTLNTNPESMSIDTLIKINKKVIKMKTGI